MYNKNTKKKKYIVPKTVFIKLGLEDIITTSYPPDPPFPPDSGLTDTSLIAQKFNTTIK